MKFKEYKVKYLDYQGKVMINVITTATNKVLEDALSEMPEWNKDFFKHKINKAGFILEYVQFDTY